MMNWEASLESNRRSEVLCMTFAAGLHILVLVWNPIVMHSDFKPIHDVVTVDMVEEAGSPLLEAPKKMTIMDTLRDMITKPKTEELAHVAPAPIVKAIAAPVAAPLLQERSRPAPISSFTPKSHDDDLAALNNRDQIQTGAKVPNVPVGGPTLKSKSFGGIRANDLPFAVGSADDSISAGRVSNIPIAMGNNSAKSGLGYANPTLTDQSKRRVGITPGLSGTGASESLSAASPAPIAIGTGGHGAAPTGAATGGDLTSRTGGGLISRAMFGNGRGSSVGSGIEGMPSAAQELNNQLTQAGAAEKTVKKKGFEIAGPLQDRPITFKVIPQYPSWAEEQGIMGSVRLYFTVDAEGNVRSGIRVMKTTGYPALDQLGTDALKQWKFSPLSGADEGTGQWGIITFTFSLAS